MPGPVCVFAVQQVALTAVALPVASVLFAGRMLAKGTRLLATGGEALTPCSQGLCRDQPSPGRTHD